MIEQIDPEADFRISFIIVNPKYGICIRSEKHSTRRAMWQYSLYRRVTIPEIEQPYLLKVYMQDQRWGLSRTLEINHIRNIIPTELSQAEKEYFEVLYMFYLQNDNKL